MTIKSKLLTTAAAITIAAGAAHAQSTATTESDMSESQEYATGWNSDLDTRYGDIADQQVAELVGMNVTSETGDNVGEVENFILDGDRLMAVVAVGGFLGLGEHDVALPLDELNFDGERLVISYTQEELEAMPEWTEEMASSANALGETDTFRTRGDIDTTEMAGSQMETTEGEASDDMGATGGELANADTSEGDMTAEGEGEQMAESSDSETMNIDEEQTAEADAEMESAEEEVAEAENAAEEAAEETEQMAENAAAETEAAAENAGEEMAQAAEETENAVEGAAAETEQMAENAAAATGSWFDKLEGEFADIASWEVNEFEGTDIATANGDVIGEVENLARQGDMVVAIVGIGGFLGLGEHDVALDLNQLSWNGENFVVNGYTQEELEAMPEYDTDSVEMIEGNRTLDSLSTM